MARGKKRKSTAKSFGGFKKSQNEKRLNRIYSEGKKDYANQNRGQSGGSSSIPSQGKKDAFLNLQKQKFFGDRDIPEERIIRRIRQEGGLNQFKQSLENKGRVLKDSRGNPILNSNTGEPIFLTDVPGGRSVGDVRQDLVSRFGPTNKEVFGDIRYGLGNIGKGISDFIGRGGAIGSVLSDLFSRVKGGTTQGIESVKGVYDNLRKNLSGEPTITTGGGSTIFTTTEEPFKDLTPRNDILVEPLETLPSQMSNEEFDNSFPFLPDRDSNLDNPLFNQQVYDPIRVSDMDMSGVMASNMGQNVIGNLQNLQNLANKYNLNRIQFDPLNPNRIGYSDQFMFNQTPVNYNISATPTGLQGGLNFTFKDGGSVDKYAGLGYKLK